MGDTSVAKRYANGDIGPRITVADVAGLEDRIAAVESGDSASTLPPVADLTALKAIAVGNLVDKVLVLCETLGLYRMDTASNDVADDTNVVRPTAFAATAGRFIRITQLADSTKANKAVPAVVDNIATLSTSGDLQDSGVLLSALATVSGYTAKVVPAAANNVATLSADGALQDSGVLLSTKADKAVPTAANNFALLDAGGNLVDSTVGAAAFTQPTSLFKATGTGANGAGSITLTSKHADFTPKVNDKIIGATGYVTATGAALAAASQPVIGTDFATLLGALGVVTQNVGYGDQTLNHYEFLILSV